MITARILWLATPRWAKMALGGLLAAVLTFGAGYALGYRDARHGAALDAAEGRIDNINDARRIEGDVEALDDDALRDDLKRRLLPPGH